VADPEPTFICVRATLDWADQEAFEAQLRDRIRPRVELWNATIKMPFHRFRQRVAEIAALNHSRVERATRAEWDRLPDGSRVVPVDDDDWFDPGLVAALDRAWRGGDEGISWSPRFLGVPSHPGHNRYVIRRRLLPWTSAHWTRDTNNYALLKGSDNRRLFEHHPSASRWFDGPGRARVTDIRAQLSINNRTLASQTSLRPTKRHGELDRGRLLRRLHRYRQIYRRRRRWLDPAWSRPYVAMMAALMDELEIR
jgi:hypothetical protein